MNMKRGTLSYQADGDTGFTEMKMPLHFVLIDANGFRITGQSSSGKFKSKLHHRKLSPYVKIWKEVDMGPNRAPDKQDFMEGNWNDIKGQADTAGCRYQSVLFAVDPASKELITINLRGKALSAWLKFISDNKDKAVKQSGDPAVAYSDSYFSITGFELTPSSIGDESYVPKFAIAKIKSSDTTKLADEKDVELQGYFMEIFGNAQATVNREDVADDTDSYSSSTAPSNPATQEEPTVNNNDITDDLPFS